MDDYYRPYVKVFVDVLKEHYPSYVSGLTITEALRDASLPICHNSISTIWHLIERAYHGKVEFIARTDTDWHRGCGFRYVVDPAKEKKAEKEYSRRPARTKKLHTITKRPKNKKQKKR